jgi:hypothetical protein
VIHSLFIVPNLLKNPWGHLLKVVIHIHLIFALPFYDDSRLCIPVGGFQTLLSRVLMGTDGSFPDSDLLFWWVIPDFDLLF